ncbi:hypothetical protein [Paenibacillus riograndensis]|uniref:Butirosin biosynthesis protein H N-terminal domain-containing protein n=1 Tax=Paenibacillus riograndensis SBR5 TaxID=1073571 RepID=A0A0E4HC09_9BACL|nr:hypothetical protein [Paenibacillus riograndensis]CQR54169.1 hypothetical protein PRIO_1759 [Paenibacillus riograndensis SBR5]
MNKFSLQVEPFNGTWMDCVSNNLISILMVHDRNFEYTPCLAKARYRLFAHGSSNENIDFPPGSSNVVTPLLDMVRTLDFSPYLDYETVTPDKEGPVHQIIKDCLHRGFYIFADVDRFYYPSGVDAGKNHLKHPAFIYGYDDEANAYLLIEDCIQPSTMESYLLPYDRFDEAMAAVRSETGTYHLVLVRKKDQELQFFSSYTKEQICSSLEFLLQEEQGPFIDHAMPSADTGVTVSYGLSVIRDFAETLEQRLLGLLKDDFEYRALAIKNPYYYRRSTIQLPFLFYRKNGLDERRLHSLTDEYKKLCNDWNVYGNTLIKYYYKLKYMKDLNWMAQSEMDALKRLLAKLYDKERDLIDKTRAVLA